MSDPASTPAAQAAAPINFSTIISTILQGVDSSIFNIVLTVSGVWFPQLAQAGANDLIVIGNNFRLFLSAIGNGAPWGQATADMLTGDWNSVDTSVAQLATDFATDVATALETVGLLPQGK